MAGRSIGNVHVDVDANTGRLTAQTKAAAQRASRDLRDIEAEPTLDSTRVMNQVRTLRQRIRQALRGAEVEVQIEPTGVSRVELEAIQKRMEAAISPVEVDVVPEVDVRRVAAAKASLRALFSKGDGGGDEAARAFASDFVGGLSQESKLIVTAALSVGDAIAVALGGAVSAATAVVSSAFGAMSAAALGSIPIIAGLGATVGVAKLAFDGLGDALEGDEDALKELSPAAREFVMHLDEMSPALDAVRRVVQRRLFAGLGDQIEDVARSALPAFTDGLDGIADQLNDFFLDLGDIAEQVDFEALFEDFEPILSDILDGIVELARRVEPFLRSAAPAAQELADGFRSAAESLGEMIDEGSESGALTDFLLRGIDSLRVWGELIVNVGDALATLFSAGQDQGDDFIQQLADMVARWDAWMESVEGQQALQDFFRLGRDVMEDLKPILDGLQEAFRNLITPESVERFGNLTETVGDMLPALGELIELIGRMEIAAVAIDTARVAFEVLSSILELIPDEVLGAVGAIIGMGAAIGGIGSAALGAVRAIGGIATAAVQAVTGLAGMARAIAAFALAHPVITGIGLALAAVGTVFLANQRAAEAAKKEVQEYVDALGDAGDVSTLKAVETVLKNLQDEQETTRRGFLDLDFAVGDWAEGVIEGAESAETGMADLLREIGPVGEEFARLLESGQLTAEELATAFDRSGGVIAALPDQIEPLGRALEDAGVSAQTARDMFDFLLDESSELGLAQEELALRTEEAGGALDRQGSAAQGTADREAHLREVTAELESAERDLSPAAQEVIRSLDGQGEAADAAREAHRKLREEMLESAETMYDHEIASHELDLAFIALQESTEEFNKDLEAGELKGRDAEKAMRELRIEELSLAEQALATAEEFANQSGAIEGSEGHARLMREELRRMQDRYPELRDEIDQYIGELESIPPHERTEIEQPGMPAARENARELDREVREIPDWADTFFNAHTGAASSAVSGLEGQVNSLDGRTIDIYTRVVRTAQNFFDSFAHGGQVGPGGGIGGEAGPELVNYGSTNALVTEPTLLPPGAMVTSAAQTRALLESLQRGGFGATTIQRQINLSQTIQTLSQDPVAVATQVVNRAAVAAVI